MKQCSKCGKEKMLIEFSKSSRNKDGFKSYCKDCKRIQDEVNRFVKSRSSMEYVHANARQAAYYDFL